MNPEIKKRLPGSEFWPNVPSPYSWLDVVLVAILLLVSAYLIRIPPENGIAVAIAPDSDEYCISLANFFEIGRFGYYLNDTFYPSKTPPWFSLFCLSPAYLLSGGDVLRLNDAILCFSLLTIVGVYVLGRLLGLGRIAYFPAVSLLLVPDFVFFSRIVMTEIPYTAVLVWLMVLYIRIATRRVRPLKGFLLAGILVFLLSSIRQTGAFSILLFILLGVHQKINIRLKLNCVAALTFPTLILFGLNLLYNWKTFGSAWRTGYQFWSPIPFDEPSLLFGWRFFWNNIECLWSSPLILLLSFFVLLSVFHCIQISKHEGFSHASMLNGCGFCVFMLLIHLSCYAGYSWSDSRFYLPLLICIVPMTICVLVDKFERKSKLFQKFFFCILFGGICLTFLCMPVRYLGLFPSRTILFEIERTIPKLVPERSVLVYAGDQNRLKYFGVERKNILQIPADRSFDYANSMVSWNSIRGQATFSPMWLWDSYIDWNLVNKGICQLPFPIAFWEQPEFVEKLLSDGFRVFYCNPKPIDSPEKVGWLERNGVRLPVTLYGTWELDAVRCSPLLSFYERIIFGNENMREHGRHQFSLFELRPME